ncbi:MAG TPA: hypothetical protein VH370_26820 [Humisphaera sp.]|jgi:hypothetical protein|nr:hypothetical protein [Humisphaera sp.]
MNRHDVVGLIGLVMFVAGIGGGVELTLLAQSRAYENVAASGGMADPRMIARAFENAMLFVKIGIPVGMLGAMLMAVALRRYLRSIHRSDRATA